MNEQSERIQDWKPWRKSTGPTSKKGKAICSRDPLKTGLYTRVALDERKALKQLIKESREFEHKVRQCTSGSP